jgi:hypothetical protein
MDFSPQDIEVLLAGTASIEEVVAAHAISAFLQAVWDVLDSDSRASIVRDMVCLRDDVEDRSATDSSDHDTDISIDSDSDDGSTRSDSSIGGEDNNGGVADAAKKYRFSCPQRESGLPLYGPWRIRRNVDLSSWLLHRRTAIQS